MMGSVLGTTDNCLILICTLFMDKDEKTKRGLVVEWGVRFQLQGYCS